MSDRQVKITLVAQVADYVQGMERAAQKTRETGTEAEKLAQKKEAFDTLGRSMLAIGTVAGVAVGIAIAKFAEFDQAMSYVQAATHETAENMDLLREAALEAGARTVFSATEAANAIEELGKAGLSTEDILSGGLDGALDLAAAGGLGVADAAGIAATALKTFNLSGRDMSHVADLLAAGAGKAMGDVSDLSQALAQGGLVAKATGLSIEETTAGLAAFASKGLLGSDAGTSFKTMLQRLNPQSAEAAERMKELNIDAYDSQGQFIGLAKYAGVLQKGMKDLTPEVRNAAMATIFGSDAVRASNVLYEEGEEGIRNWTSAVDDQGFAAETAAMRLDNLAGDVEALGGAFDTALIKTGSAGNDVLRGMVQLATNAVDAYGNLPEPVQAGTFATLALVAAVGLSGGTFLLAVPKIAAYKVALETMGGAAQRTGRALGVATKAAGVVAGVGVAVLALDAWRQAVEAGAVSAEELSNAIQTAGNAQELFSKTLVNRGSSAIPDYKPFINDMSKLGELIEANAGYVDNFFGEFGRVVDYRTKDIDAYREGWSKLGKELAELEKNGNAEAVSGALVRIKTEANLTNDQLYELIQASPELNDAFIAQASAAGLSADKQTILQLALSSTRVQASNTAAAYLDNASAASTLDDQVRDLINTMLKAAGAGQDAVTTNANYTQTLADVDEAIRSQVDASGQLSNALDESTLAGAQNAAMLAGMAADSQDAAKAQLDLDGNTANYKNTLEAGRAAVYERALALTGNAEAAQRLTDKIYAIPTERQFEMIAKTSEAKTSLEKFQEMLNSIPSQRIVDIIVRGANKMNVTDGPGYAGGGYTPPGPKYQPVGIVHAGEFVSTQETLAHPENRSALEYMHRGGVIPGYSNGGLVGSLATHLSATPDDNRVNALAVWREAEQRFGVPGYARGGMVAQPLYAPDRAAQPVMHVREGDTWSPVFQLTPLPGRPLAEQVFEAARRLKSHRR